MRKKVGIIKRLFTLLLVFLLSINSFAAIVSDNDGSAFITKAEFDALKASFQAQIDTYNQSIDSKIDGAIASYLAGIKLSRTVDIKPLPGENVKWKIYGENDIAFENSSDALCQYENNIGYPGSIIKVYGTPGAGKTWDTGWANQSWANFMDASAIYYAQPTGTTSIFSDPAYDTQSLAVANEYEFNGSYYYFLDNYATKNTLKVLAAGQITPYYFNILTNAPYSGWQPVQTEFENDTKWNRTIASTAKMQSDWTSIRETVEIKIGYVYSTVWSGVYDATTSRAVDFKSYYWSFGGSTQGKYAVNWQRTLSGQEPYNFLLNKDITLPLGKIDKNRYTSLIWPTNTGDTATQRAIAISYGTYLLTAPKIEPDGSGSGGAPSLKCRTHAYYAIALPRWSSTDTSASSLYNQQLTELLGTTIKCTDGLPILITGKKGTYKVTLKVTKTTGTSTYANLKLSSTPFGTGYTGGTNIPYKISGTTTTQVPYGSQQVLEFDFEEENKVIYLQLQDKTKTDSGAIVEIISIEETLED